MIAFSKRNYQRKDVRTVIAPISKLGLNLNDTITVALISSVGKPLLTNDGYFYSENIEILSDTLTLNLRENDTIENISEYRLTTPKEFSFSFRVPSSPVLDDTPHDLISLLNIGCYKEIIEIYENKATLHPKFLSKLDIFFTGENPYFTDQEKSLVDLYEYYADNVISMDSTIDVVRMMDEHLATILPPETE